MPEIGVRELKSRASEIIRALRETRARYLVTYRGKPVAVLMPLAEAEHEQMAAGAPEDVWQELVALGEEVGRGWQSDRSGVEILSEMRR